MEHSNDVTAEDSNNPNSRKKLLRMLYESTLAVFLWFFIPFNLLLMWNEPLQVRHNRSEIQKRLRMVDQHLNSLNSQTGGNKLEERERLRANDLKRKACYENIIGSGWTASKASCLNSTGEDFKRSETLEDYRYWHSPGYYLKRIFWLLMPLYLYLLNRYLIGASPVSQGKTQRSLRRFRPWLSSKYKRPLVRKIRRAL